MLKFENTAKVGDIIKAYDFKPMADRPDVFLAGRVIEKGEMYQDFEGRKVYIGNGYTVEVLGGDEKSREYRKGTTMYVPFEIDFMEFDERVQRIITAEEIEMVAAYENEEVFH